jgi:hypothetical protein
MMISAAANVIESHMSECSNVVRSIVSDEQNKCRISVNKPGMGQVKGRASDSIKGKRSDHNKKTCYLGHRRRRCS